MTATAVGLKGTRIVAAAAGLVAALQLAALGRVPRGAPPAPYAQLTVSVPGELDPPGTRTPLAGPLTAEHPRSAALELANVAGRARLVMFRVSVSDRALARHVRLELRSGTRSLRALALAPAQAGAQKIVDERPLRPRERRRYRFSLSAESAARRFAARALDVRVDVATAAPPRTRRAHTGRNGR